MVDIGRDIEWEQNFEIDEKIQAEAQRGSDDNQSVHSQSPDVSSSGDDGDGDGANRAHDEMVRKKRPRRPSYAELKERAMQQQKDSESADLSVQIKDRNVWSSGSGDEASSGLVVGDSVSNGIATKEAMSGTTTWSGSPVSELKGKDQGTESMESVDGELASRRDFYSKSKHVLIVTWGGRPLFSRWGSVSDRFMTSLFGVISLMPCNVERVNVRSGDEVRSFETLDGVKMIYLQCGPLYLFCVSRSGESIDQIRNQLRFCHLLVVMTLTNVFEKTLAQSPQFDLRSIFGPTDYMMLHQLVLDQDRSPRFLFNSFCPLQMAADCRQQIGSVLVRCKKEVVTNDDEEDKSWRRKLLYSVLLVRGRVVHYAEPKKKVFSLHHEDLILLAHFVRNSRSWKQSEAFTPICLPHFEASGFVYCYVSYFGLDDHSENQPDSGHRLNDHDICSIALTLDSGSFKRCQSLRKRIERTLSAQSLMKSLTECSAVDDAFSIKFILDTVFGAAARPQVFMFYFNDIQRNQFVAPRPLKLYDTDQGRKTLFQRLQHLQHRIHSTPKHPLFFQRTASDAAVCRHQEGHYEMYVILNPLVSKSDALDVLQKLTRFVLDRSKDLFMQPAHW